MQHVEVDVEFNGIVVFDPLNLKNHYGNIQSGENLFKRYIETDEGDEVIGAGLIVPILSIDDAGYDVVLMKEGEVCEEEKCVIARNEFLFLEIIEKAIICDLYAIMDWDDSISVDYNVVDLVPGKYKVSIGGYRKMLGSNIEKAGYILKFAPVDLIGEVTADLGKNMRVLDR
jgi:hypothetical protein